MQFTDISKKLFKRIIKIILEGKIHFEHFPSLSFFSSQGHNSFNIESKSTSRTISESTDQGLSFSTKAPLGLHALQWEE